MIESGPGPVSDCVVQGMEEFTSYCERLEGECENGSAAACAALSVLDALSRGISGKNATIMLRQLHETVGAYRGRFKCWKSAFHATDRDRSGDIDRKEFKATLRSFGIELEDESVEEVFDAADLNKDGLIQKEEFESVLWDGGLEFSAFETGSKMEFRIVD